MMYGTSDEAKITEGNDNVDRITKLLDLGTWDVESQKARNTIVRDEVDKMHNPNMNIFDASSSCWLCNFYISLQPCSWESHS
ncbi:hypothetical protein GCM10020331_011920 [Ectobacillus funiculus]